MRGNALAFRVKAENLMRLVGVYLEKGSSNCLSAQPQIATNVIGSSALLYNKRDRHDQKAGTALYFRLFKKLPSICLV